MPQENVELVRRSVEELDPTFAHVVALWDPEIDWRAIEGAPDDVGVFKGHEAMRRYYAQWFDTFDDLRAQPEEVIDVPDDRVIAVLHVTGRMKDSEAEVDMRLAILYTVRDGLIVRGREYATREQALEAAGLGNSA
jgi:ketosteroid isomerase-like protein